MGKSKLGKMQLLVEKCLEEDVASRSCDWKLYEDVCKKLGYNPSSITIHDIVQNTKDFPAYATVIRCRRKIQEKGKYLANATVKEFRRQQELDFIKEFA